MFLWKIVARNLYDRTSLKTSQHKARRSVYVAFLWSALIGPWSVSSLKIQLPGFSERSLSSVSLDQCWFSFLT